MVTYNGILVINESGNQIGKIRHLKNTMEVCCHNSTAADFTSYGWTIAKDYALKVEEEVSQKLVTWQDMESKVRTSTLVLAQMDYPRPALKNVDKKLKDNEKKELVCYTFNKCTTKGKCEYEVTNPDKTCQRKHECSWCKSNLKQSCNHQAWECKRSGK